MASATSYHDVSFDDLVACPGCDVLHHKRQLQPGEFARCERCNDVIQTCKPHTVDRTLAATLAALTLLLLSLFTPFLSLSRAGIESSISLLDAVQSLWESQMRWLGLTTLALIVLLPLGRLLLMGFVLVRLRLKRKVRRSMRIAFRWALKLEPWAMADIFMVGVVVSLVKISTLANLSVGIAFWALLALVGVSWLISSALCKDTIWTQLRQDQ
ncbi:MAG: paraquat-inducible protein A [Granulosicoccus sp.]